MVWHAVDAPASRTGDKELRELDEYLVKPGKTGLQPVSQKTFAIKAG